MKINTVLITYNDPDFTVMFEYIGWLLVNSAFTKNYCDRPIIDTEEKIKSFVIDCIPIAYLYAQQTDREMDYSEANRYKELFKDIKFVFNFGFDNEDYKYGGSESMIVDFIEQTHTMI